MTPQEPVRFDRNLLADGDGDDARARPNDAPQTSELRRTMIKACAIHMFVWPNNAHENCLFESLKFLEK